MNKPGFTLRSSPSVVIVAEDRPGANRVQAALPEADFRIVASVTSSSLDGPPSADVVIVVGPLGPRIEPLLGKVERSTRIVVCTDPVNTSTLRWALNKGVDGVVWNDDVDSKLTVTVLAVWSGQLVFPAVFRRANALRNLSNREKQALSLVIMGLTNREIAENLFVSESTVKSHLNAAYRKLGVTSRVEAAEMITDPEKGLGTGILAITPRGHARVRRKGSVRRKES